jgi:ribA/ribD-fused uncharacterized protein
VPAKIDSFNGQYKFLSNFYELRWPVVCEHRLTYLTVENAYQASKSMYYNDRRAIKDLPPHKAKTAGHQLTTLRPNWEQIKRAVMTELLLQKFINNEDCREWLLETGDALLVEGNHHGDRYWGMVNGIGENHLGRLLMGVRKLLRED